MFVDYYNTSSKIATRAPERHEGEEIDGMVYIYSPSQREKGQPFRFGAWPFRTAEKGGADTSIPIWEWKNPDDPLEDIDLAPVCDISICDERHAFFIRDGYVIPVAYAEL